MKRFYKNGRKLFYKTKNPLFSSISQRPFINDNIIINILSSFFD